MELIGYAEDSKSTRLSDATDFQFGRYVKAWLPKYITIGLGDMGSLQPKENLATHRGNLKNEVGLWLNARH